jgi:hypothetical protein
VNIPGNPNSPVLGQALCNCLLSLGQQNDGLALSKLAEEIIGPVTDYGLIQETSIAPRVGWTINNGEGLFFFYGTTTVDQLVAEFNGYKGGVGDSITNPVNVAFLDAAVQIMVKYSQQPHVQPLKWTFAGWSFGGCVAQIFPTLSPGAILPLTPVDIVTFGSPRIGGPGIRSLVNGRSTIYRWMNDTDPFPFIPPRIEDTPLVFGAFGATGALRAAHFVQAGEGASLEPNGKATPSALPLNTSGRFQGAFVSWMLSYVQGTTSTHWLAEYSRRLGLLVAANKSVLVPMGGGHDAPNPTNRRDLNRAENEVVNKVRDIAERQNQVAESIPDPFRPYAARAGRLWVVVFQDQVIVTCANQKIARRIARDMRDFLRSLQRQPVVDPTAIVNLLGQYFGQATDVAGQFAPVMNTDIPV